MPYNPPPRPNSLNPWYLKLTYRTPEDKVLTSQKRHDEDQSVTRVYSESRYLASNRWLGDGPSCGKYPDMHEYGYYLEVVTCTKVKVIEYIGR